MTIFKLSFAGQIKKAEHRNAGSKPIVELQICRKNGKEESDGFTWVRVTVWEPAAWLAPKLVPGAFVAGCGEFKMRSYDAKDGSKRQSAEVRCTSFDLDCADGGAPAAPAAPRPATPATPPAAKEMHDEPPF